MKTAIAILSLLALVACSGPRGQFCKEGSRVVFKEGLRGEHPNCVDIDCPGELVMQGDVLMCVAAPSR